CRGLLDAPTALPALDLAQRQAAEPAARLDQPEMLLDAGKDLTENQLANVVPRAAVEVRAGPREDASAALQRQTGSTRQHDAAEAVGIPLRTRHEAHEVEDIDHALDIRLVHRAARPGLVEFR